MRQRSLLTLIALVLGAWVLAACTGDVSIGADSEPTTTPAAAAPAATATPIPDLFSPTPEITETVVDNTALLEQIQVAGLRTASGSGDFTFSSVTTFAGGEVAVTSGGVFDRGNQAMAFDVFIAEPDPEGAILNSTRSYVLVDAEGFYSSDEAPEWTAFEPAELLNDPEIAQGMFVDAEDPGSPPLVSLLTAAQDPVVNLGATQTATGEDAMRYTVALPITTAYRALGPASYQAFLDDGIDPALFPGTVPAEVLVDTDGQVRQVTVELADIFQQAAALESLDADTAALMASLDVTMVVQLSDLEREVDVVRPIPLPQRVDGSFVAGQCYGNVDLTSLEIEPLDCAEPHLYEVFEVRTRPEDEDAPYPGDNTVFENTLASCRDSFRTLYGLPDAVTTVEIYVVYPSVDTWRAGDREIACAGQFPLLTELTLGNFDLQRSFGVVTTYGLQPGDCFAAEVDFGFVGVPVSDCAAEHTYEVYHRTELTTSEYPGDSDIEQLADELCEVRYEEFVGVEVQFSQHDYTFFWPSEFGWTELDDRSVTCMIELARPLEGSLEGQQL